MSELTSDTLSETLPCQQLVPPCEMFHISVAIILVNDSVELASVHKGHQLGENVFALYMVRQIEEP